MPNSLFVDTDEVDQISSDLIRESSDTTSATDETNAASEKFRDASEAAEQEANKHLSGSREVAENLRNASKSFEDEDRRAVAQTERIDPEASTTRLSASGDGQASGNTSPKEMLALLEAQQQQQAEQQAAKQAEQQAHARNQAQYQQYVEQQQRQAQQMAQQQQLAYNQQQQALALQQQQQSALMAQQQAQALAAQGQNVDTITNSNGEYLIHKDDLAAILNEVQNSRAGDMLLGDSSLGDARTGYNVGDVPFTLGEITDAGTLDPSEVTFEKDPENAILTEDEVDAVINAALDANGVTDDPEVRGKWIEVMRYIQEHESQSVVNAANGWDSNAHGEIQSDTYPRNSSRGMWQCIPDTFAANHVEGTSTSIYDPTASCAAAVRYLMGRYNCDPMTGEGLDEFYNARYPVYKGY